MTFAHIIVTLDMWGPERKGWLGGGDITPVYGYRKCLTSDQGRSGYFGYDINPKAMMLYINALEENFYQP